MKLLLTSAGISNESIAKALDNLTGLSRSEIKIGFIPTSANREPGNKDWFLNQLTDLYKYNFKWIDFIDFSASGVNWEERLSECNIVYISGGNTFHLLNEVRKYKFDEWIKENIERKVFVGTSAGSILFTPTIAIAQVEPADTNYAGITDLSGLGIVNFEISPHTPETLTYEANEKYASKSKNKLYVLDDNSAVEVQGSSINVISEGKWKLLN